MKLGINSFFIQVLYNKLDGTLYIYQRVSGNNFQFKIAFDSLKIIVALTELFGITLGYRILNFNMQRL